MGFFRRLFGRRTVLAPIHEEEAYARSYGDRSGDLVKVRPAEPKLEPKPVELPPIEPTPIPQETGELTGELLRRAFETRLDRRGTHSHVR
jgi:hypothetical protein